MRGMGKQRRSSGSPDGSERGLFRELGAKSARSSASRANAPRRPRGRFVALLTILVVGAATVFAVATAFADNPTGSGYTIGDGIIGDIGTTFFPDPVGSVDELGPENGADTKLDVINTASPPMLEFTNVNGGVDLSGMWLDTNVDPTTGDVWLYFAFSREAATTGQIAFEFERSPLPVACDFTNVSPIKNGNLTAAQSALIASCNPWKNRQAGDFMIVWDTQGNSTTLNKRNYSGTSFGSAQVIPANGYKVAVTADELKGEAAINLTTSGIFPASPTQCLTIANVKANTITGNSDQADFKDTVLADTSGVGISNCGQIRVTKDTDPEGGSGTFPYTVTRDPVSALKFDNSTSATGTLTSDGDSDLLTDIKAGPDYRLAEGPLAADWMLQSITCVKGGTTYDVVPGNQKFAVDSSTITDCEIKNVPKPKLTLTKNVVNNSGGTATPDLWTLAAAGTGGFSGSGNSADVTNRVVIAGQEYTLSESGGAAGYASNGVWSCTGGGTFVSPNKITLGNGQNVSCTITNDDVPGTLVVKKVVVNDNGGAKTAVDFAFDVAGPSVSNDVSFEADGQNDLTVKAGTYNVVENADAGYTTTYSADCSNAVIVNGGSKTCTITNDDVPGTLVVKKVVVNDNGGAKTAVDFAFDVAGPSVSNDVSFEADGQNDLTVKAGTYNVVENADAGYTTTYSADCSNAVIVNGGSKTCTITNDDVPGTLIVKKIVINDEGGTKTGGDFTFKVGEANPVAFVQDQADASKGEKSVSVSAGTYTVTEPAVPGYDASYEDCANVVVGNGDTKTCTITNDDNAKPTVDVQKTVRVAGTDGAYAETASAPEPGGTFQYRVVIWNTSKEVVTLTALTDTIGLVVTDLDGKGSCSAPQSLAASDGTSGGADTYTCTFELALHGNAGDSQSDTVKATVKDDEDDTASDEDSASVSLTDVGSSILVTKTADPTTLDESTIGSDVVYTVVVKNTSTVDTVTVDAQGFVDRVALNSDPATGNVVALSNLDCNIANSEDDGLPFTLDPAESITCTFSMSVKGNAGDQINDLITVTGKDDDDNDVSGSDDATVTITDVPSTITVTKTANPTIVQDSGPVTFTVVVRNDSAVDTVYIETLTDSIYGNLNPRGTCTLEDGIDEGPAGSRRILPSASYTCSFTETVSKTETDVVTALGVDDDDKAVSGHDDATVTVNRTPPPPTIPSTDISVTKAATPQVQLPQGGGTASITYNLVVVNNGPDAAANVKVADTAPASVSFASATTSAGTCTTTAQALDCTIVSLAPGASVAITINATVNATGTKVNVVLVTTTTPETNGKNNQASAQTVVAAPLTPPKPPKPVVKADICRTLVANPKMLKANGKAQRISIKVTQGTKGVAGISVKITGPGISKTVISGKGGKIKVTVKPSQPGIIRLAIQGKKACNTQRIGVVGIFEPPVTG